MKNYQFPVIITQDEDDVYMARVPTLPGCHTQAKTLPALYRRIKEVIELCLEVQREKRQKVYQETFVRVKEFCVSA